MTNVQINKFLAWGILIFSVTALSDRLIGLHEIVICSLYVAAVILELIGLAKMSKK